MKDREDQKEAVAAEIEGERTFLTYEARWRGRTLERLS